MQTADVGETAPLTSYWWDKDDVGAEPSAITLTIHPPTAADIVKVKADLTGTKSDPAGATDTWEWGQLLSETGVWRFTFVGTVDGVELTQSGILLAGEASVAPGPCEPWATWGDVLNTCPTIDLSTIKPGVAAQLLDRATWILYSLDGRHYPGICTGTHRICRSCVRCATSCCCRPRSSLDLGGRWPVWGVWDVTIDGEVLPGAAYQLRDRRFLDRLDGDSWPACADLTDPDAFTLSRAYGRRPPVGLRDGAALFTAEMAKSCLGLKCELPSRVTTVTREGVTYVVLDSQNFIDKGRTGFYPVDMALRASAEGRQASPGVFSPYGAPTHSARVE